MSGSSVNRYLRDKAMDHIDHALGRPLDPMAKTYRNYFAIDGDSDLAREFRTSDHWHEGGRDGTMSYFTVTHEGREALAAHLNQIGSKHRLYRVWLNGEEMTPIIATSHAKARYLKFLDFDDGQTFGEFCKSTRVRLADGV
jgi:hypothetical protein